MAYLSVKWLFNIGLLLVPLTSYILVCEGNEINAMVLAETQEESAEKSTEKSIEYDHKRPTFIPTNEWQLILPDQAIPRGLHVRINLETGKKEAKLLDHMEEKEPDIIDINSEKHLKKINAQYKEKLKNIKDEDGKSPLELAKESETRAKEFRTYEELKEDLHDLMFNVETEQEIVHNFIHDYTESDDHHQKLNILFQLEDLLHQIDNAIAFIDLGGIKKIIKGGLNSSDVEIVSSVLSLIGSSSQSNPKVQIAMIEAEVLRKILNIIQSNFQSDVKTKAVFALSCIVRGFPYGHKAFINTGGLQILRHIFDERDGKNSKLKLKVLSLVQDLIEEKDNSNGEKLKQLSDVDLHELIIEGDWCKAISHFFNLISNSILAGVNTDVDSIDKVISVMMTLSKDCRNEFNNNVEHNLNLLRSSFRIVLEEQDHDGYYQQLFNEISHLWTIVSVKDEL